MTIKRLVLALVVVGLTASAYYSYGRVDFGRRTGMFFRAALGGGQPGGRVPPRVDPTQPGQSPEGGPPPGAAGRGGMRPRRGQMIARGPEAGPTAAQPPSRGVRPPDGGGNPGLAARGPEGERRAGLGPDFGGRGNVSLGTVLGYTSILGFVTMLTVLTDRGLCLLARRSRSARPGT